MSAPVFHRHGVYGPVCGTFQGVDAADMEPPEITCLRCRKAPQSPYDLHQVISRDGGMFIATPAEVEAMAEAAAEKWERQDQAEQERFGQWLEQHS